MATCSLQTYYCADNPIVVNSTILYINSVSPLIPVPAGYYATQVGTGNGIVYKVDATGLVIDILGPGDTECANQTITTYKYYKATKYSCGTCGTEEDIVYVAVNSLMNLVVGFYYTDGATPVNDNTKVYKIRVDEPTTSPQIFDTIIEPSTGASTCEVSCYGHITLES